MNLQDNGERNEVVIPPDTPGTLSIVIHGHENRLRIGAGCRFPNMRIDIRANRCVIEIGDGCALIGEIHCRDHDTKLFIGAKTTTMGVKITMHEPGTIRIGEDCMFAGDVRMDTSDMHSLLDMSTGDRLNPPGDVEIGDHVWLGYGTYVMSGVTIGPGCVVGTGSIVTKSLPPHSLAVGVPAKIIRSGVTWDRRRLPLKNPPAKT
jgi:acetyltransferase-like isoleucine patch superfamily enzyme